MDRLVRCSRCSRRVFPFEITFDGCRECAADRTFLASVFVGLGVMAFVAVGGCLLLIALPT